FRSFPGISVKSLFGSIAPFWRADFFCLKEGRRKMQTHFVATPFGRRAMSLGMIASQAAVRDIPAGTRVNKWEVFRHIREARDLIGATDRGLAILNALLSFHPETELAGDGELVVWPSNEQLMARANGMPATTL